MAKITCTNGNKANGIKGSRITIRSISGYIVDQLTVSRRNGIQYCKDHPTGKYGTRFQKALDLEKVISKLDLYMS